MFSSAARLADRNQRTWALLEVFFHLRSYLKTLYFLDEKKKLINS